MSEANNHSGGCLCGAIRFDVDAAGVISAHHCHCRDCQRSTGSAMATIVIMPSAHYRLVSGTPKSHTVTAESGGKVTRSFCGDCGSPISSEVSAMPGVTFVKGGVFDDPRWIAPASSFWTSSAQPWAHVDSDIPGFEKNPEL